ncbi:MAG: zinc-binding dehydrogenase [Alphaproteobacteria bacterium]|nr:zinc-binding dehydrogenase [Alphaproteobacteria bacterium]
MLARSAYYDDCGPAREVLKVDRLDIGEPGSGEVLVRLHASGVNPTDVKTRGGAPGRGKPFPRIVPHHDGAGVIERVGDNVPVDQVGRRVWVFSGQHERPFGTASEYITLPAEQAVPLPDTVSFDLGACLGIPALTAWNAVLADGPVAGRVVLVAGAAGAVGNLAVQIARFHGATVIGTVSSDAKASRATEAGAHHTVDYTAPDAAERILTLTYGRGVDLFVDVDTTANAVLLGRVMALGGRVASYGSGGLGAELPVRDLRQRCVSVRFLTIFRFGPSVLRPAAAGVNAMLEAGALDVRIGQTLPLDDISSAHELLESGRQDGRVLIGLS